MKKTLVLGLAVGLVSMAASAFAGPSAPMAIPTPGYPNQKNTGGTGIVGSSHDMSNVAGKTVGGASWTSAQYSSGGPDVQKRICVFCHHPHNAMASNGKTGYVEGATGGGASYTGTLEYSPLWNRVLSTTSFVGYSNGIMMGGNSVLGSDKRHALNAADVGGGTKIAGVSLLCMSCHDGVTAMNAYSQTTGSSQNAGANTINSAITSTAGFKGDMNNHHPMGFQYVAVQGVDAEIADPNTVMVPGTSTTIADLLYGPNHTMECVTCHDVHNTQNEKGAERFLWRSDNQSNFCLTCHLK